MEENKNTSRGSNRKSYLPTFFCADEMDVSDTLLNLETLFYERDCPLLQVTWSSTRKRSAINLIPSQEETEKEKKPKLKAEALSPTTPFSLSPSESDETSKQSPEQIFKKTTREECLLLHPISAGHQDDHHSQIHVMAHQQSSILDQIVHGSQTNKNFGQHSYEKIDPFLQSGYGSGKAMQMGQLCIPDLNISADETFGMGASQPLDSSIALRIVDKKKAIAAEARSKRMMKMRKMKRSYGKIK